MRHWDSGQGTKIRWTKVPGRAAGIQGLRWSPLDMTEGKTHTAGDQISWIGTTVQSIPLIISYRMIDVFSGQLYSNPAKAVEELVANSYDAFARTCHVVLPDSPNTPDARVIVWDDGEGMDIAGLQELWLVAATHKRDPERERAAARKGRLPVGKFGVGKLASYVLGRRITHISRRGNEILAITVDYTEIVPKSHESVEDQAQQRTIQLPVRSLTEEQTSQILGGKPQLQLPNGQSLTLVGPGSSKRWTLVIVDHLKEAAQGMSIGRLRWIISTALPLVPDFSVYLNGERVNPSKLDLREIHHWIVGKDDQVAKSKGLPTEVLVLKTGRRISRAKLPGVGWISGRFTLYEDSLVGGKAEEFGRSNGFFVMVRGRLVDHDDPLFGTHPLSLGTINRLRAVVHADGLDDSLVVSREKVGESQRRALQDYLSAKFHEIQVFYDEYRRTQDKEEALEDRITALPSPLAAFPIAQYVTRSGKEGRPIGLAYLPPPAGKSPVDRITGISLNQLEPIQPLAMYDGASGAVQINENHPLYQNYFDEDSLRIFALAEVVLEAYLSEREVPTDDVVAIMRKRDDLLRALGSKAPRSVTLIAQNLRDSVRDEDKLEEACHLAFRALGFDVTPLGQPGRADGLAYGTASTVGPYAVAGIGAFKVSYDAKSTSHPKVKSGDLHLSTVANHRDEDDADFATIIGIDFEVEGGESCKAIKEARKQRVSLFRVQDFSELVRISGTKPLPLGRLHEMFSKCVTPDEIQAWVRAFRSEPSAPRPDLPLLIRTIHEMQQKDPLARPSFSALRYARPEFKSFSESDLEEWAKALSRLRPELISVYGGRVELGQSPEVVIQHLQQVFKQSGPPP